MSWFNSQRALEQKSIFGFSTSLTPASTASAVSAEQAFTVPAKDLPVGVTLKSTDLVFVTGPSSGNAASLTTARINSTGQLVLRITNPTAGALTHAAGVFSCFIVRL